MRHILILIFLVSTLFSAKEDSCYSVQLMSFLPSSKDYDKAVNAKYDDSCKIINISNNIAIRCGCYENRNRAKDEILKFKIKYAKAYIVSTYKYRFDDVKKIDTSLISPLKKEKIPFTLNNKDLLLSLETFFYVGDFKRAYEISKIGYECNPDSFYWNFKMAEFSKYKKQDKESTKHMIEIYLNGYDEEYMPIVISDDKYIKRWNSKGIDKYLNLEYMTDDKRSESLAMFLKLYVMYIETGNEESASRVIALKKKNLKYTSLDAEQLLLYYYFENDLKLAYSSLLLAYDENASVSYYQLLGDLAWYYKDYELSGDAAYSLYKINGARAIDYERINYLNYRVDGVNRDKEYAVAKERLRQYLSSLVHIEDEASL